VGYTATKGGASGRAQLDWQPLDEQQYRLTWRLELAGREAWPGAARAMSARPA
jgi:hypothetical protein